MSQMFNNCENLKEINMSNFNLNKECKIDNIFNGINKKECKLITNNEIIKNIFNKQNSIFKFNNK